MLIKFAVVGTNRITRQFIDAALATGKYQLVAVYSRTEEQAQLFARDFDVSLIFTSLENMAKCSIIDAVYIASPNSLHAEQSKLFLNHKKHVICEKPFASNSREAEEVTTCALDNHRVLFEAFKTASLPNFKKLQASLSKVGKIRKVLFNYCQYSSRYQAYLDGKQPNTFNPKFSNGSIMDIGFYTLASAITLWGKPHTIQATASLLPSGVDAHGTVLMNYHDFDVTLLHSKVSNSMIASEIQGEAGSIVIDKLSECSRITFIPREGESQDLSVSQASNTMSYEAESFAELIQKNHINHDALSISKYVAELSTEIRLQTGVKFPADDK